MFIGDADDLKKASDNTLRFKAYYVKGRDFTLQRNMPDHYHGHYEIYYFLGDSMTFFLDDSPMRLKKNDLVLVDRHVYHRTFYYPKTVHDRVNISFDTDDIIIPDEGIVKSIEELFAKPRLSTDNPAINQKIHDDIRRLCECVSGHGGIKELKARVILSELLLDLLGISHLFKSHGTGLGLNTTEKKVQDITAFINSNYSKPLTLNSISKKFFVSKYYLCHVFKRITGMTVNAFLNRKRLLEAEILLRHTDYRISDISHRTGFNSHSHFIRQFKKHYGCTPGEYRKTDTCKHEGINVQKSY